MNQERLEEKLFDSVISYGQIALKAALVVSIANVVIVVAFMLSLSRYHELVASLEFACVGLFAALIASGVIYVNQFFYAIGKKKAGDYLMPGSWLGIILSYVYYVASTLSLFDVLRGI